MKNSDSQPASAVNADNNNTGNNISDTKKTNGNNGNNGNNGTESSTPPTYELPKKLAILYTEAKREYFQTEQVYITEKDAEKEANIIAEHVRQLGIECYTISGGVDMIKEIEKHNPEMVFNLAYSVRGSDYLGSTVPAILDFLNIPYTGADFFGYAINTDKEFTKRNLQRVGVPVPNFQLFETPTDSISYQLRFPLISKLNELHCAIEIDENAVSEDEKHLRERLKFLIGTYKQPVIVEEFIAGREITAILLEGINKKVYFGEKMFHDLDRKFIFTTFNDQWDDTKEEVFHYEKYDDQKLRDYTKKAFEALDMYDYAKFDVRLDQSGRYYFVDANCNPAFGPKIMNVAISSILDMYGIPFTEILKRLIINTMYFPTQNQTDPAKTGNGNGVNG